MRTCIILIIVLFTTSLVVVAGETKTLPTNEYVKFSVALKEKSLKAGRAGNLLIRLQPKKGIHINLKPAISMAFDTTGMNVHAGTPTIPKADTFLNISKPIQQPFTLDKNVKTGTVVLKGSVTYYYCSDADGWCSRFKQPFEIPVNITR